MTVSPNGIKKNGHLFIDNLSAKHSLTCLQETMFADVEHLNTFKFHLYSYFCPQILRQ